MTLDDRQREGMETLEDLRPSDTPSYMTDAWVGCLRWAVGQPEIVARFREETGNKWSPGRTAIERMVEDATNASHHFMVDFVRWVNVHVWGPMEVIDESS